MSLEGENGRLVIREEFVERGPISKKVDARVPVIITQRDRNTDAHASNESQKKINSRFNY